MLYAHMYDTYRAPYNLAYLTGFDLEYKRWLIGKVGKNPTKKIVQPIKNSLAMKIVVMYVVVVVVGVIYLLYSYGYLSIQIMCCCFSCLTNLTRSLY